MFDILPIALPAVLVVFVAVVLVHRERSDRIVDLTEWDDVAMVPVVDARARSSSRANVSGGALIDPGGASLGARIRATTPDEERPHGRVRIRRRDQPLVAARAES